MHTNQFREFFNKKVSYHLRLFVFSFFFPAFLFSSFHIFFAAVVGFPLGLLAVQEFQTENSCHWVAKGSQGKFSSKFLTQITRHILNISSSINPITLICVSLERSFPPAEIEYKWCLFGQRWGIRGETVKGPCLSQPVLSGTGANGLNQNGVLFDLGPVIIKF